MLKHSEFVYVKRVRGKGRGVFARRPIPKGTVIEQVPVILVPLRYVNGRAPVPELARVCFVRDRKLAQIALGYGSLYNHSYSPNAHYEDEDGPSLLFRSLRAIEKGEEITINYNGDPKDRGSVGFKVH
jgi:SET domain-containing protein